VKVKVKELAELVELIKVRWSTEYCRATIKVNVLATWDVYRVH
jgi:hypothetical protein